MRAVAALSQSRHWVMTAYRSAATGDSNTRIEWPLNDYVQAYFEYYEGALPEDERVVEFKKRLNRIAQKYAHHVTEWLWDEREYRF